MFLPVCQSPRDRWLTQGLLGPSGDYLRPQELGFPRLFRPSIRESHSQSHDEHRAADGPTPGEVDDVGHGKSAAVDHQEQEGPLYQPGEHCQEKHQDEVKEGRWTSKTWTTFISDVYVFCQRFLNFLPRNNVPYVTIRLQNVARMPEHLIIIFVQALCMLVLTSKEHSLMRESFCGILVRAFSCPKVRICREK